MKVLNKPVPQLNTDSDSLGWTKLKDAHRALDITDSLKVSTRIPSSQRKWKSNREVATAENESLMAFAPIIYIALGSYLGSELKDLSKLKPNTVGIINQTLVKEPVLYSLSYLLSSSIYGTADVDKVSVSEIRQPDISFMTQLAHEYYVKTQTIEQIPTDFAPSLLAECKNLIEQKLNDNAIYFLMKKVDRKLRDEEYQVVDRLLSEIDVSDLTTECQLALLTITSHWRDSLINWNQYFERFRTHLFTIGKTRKDVKAILEGLS